MKYDEDGMRMTDCCGAASTYMEGQLCCKACYNLVDFGEGDGTEWQEGSKYASMMETRTKQALERDHESRGGWAPWH